MFNESILSVRSYLGKSLDSVALEEERRWKHQAIHHSSTLLVSLSSHLLCSVEDTQVESRLSGGG